MTKDIIINDVIIMGAVYEIHKEVLRLRDGEPMDGDAVDDLCEIIKENLNDLNGNK